MDLGHTAIRLAKMKNICLKPTMVYTMLGLRHIFFIFAWHNLIPLLATVEVANCEVVTAAGII